MSDEPGNSNAARNSSSSVRSLARIAEVLGVPASSFLGQEGDAPSEGSRTEPNEAAILKLIGAYLGTISIDRRKHFLAAVQTMVEGPQGPPANDT